MKSVLIFFIVLCALFSPLLPFLPIPIILYNNLDTNVSESKPEENNQNNNDVEIDITSEAEEEENKLIIPDCFISEDEDTGIGSIAYPIVDTTINLGTYASVNIPGDYIIIDEAASVDFVKIAKMSYCDEVVKIGVVTHNSEDGEGFTKYAKVISKVSGVEISEPELEYEYNSEIGLIQAKAEYTLDNKYHTIYCIMSEEDNLAVWLDTERSTEENYSEYLTKNVLYTVTFGDVPKQSDSETSEEDEKPTGFVDTNAENDLSSTEIVVGNSVVNVGMNFGRLIDSGYQLYNSTVNLDTVIEKNQRLNVTVKNNEHAVLFLEIYNRYDTSVALRDCIISSIMMDFSKFEKLQTMTGDYVILPGGVTRNVYTEDVFNEFGEPEKIDINEDETITCTWNFSDRTVKLTLGSISYIKIIEISLNIDR